MADPDINVFEDRSLAVVAELDIAVPDQVYAIEQAIQARYRATAVRAGAGH